MINSNNEMQIKTNGPNDGNHWGGFVKIIKVYFFLSLALAILLPVDGIDENQFIQKFINYFVDIFSGIENIAQHAKNKNYIKSYYVIQWIISPVIFCLLFLSARRLKKSYFKIPLILYFYALFFLILSSILIYALGFQYKPGNIISTAGRGGLLMYGLSARYLVGLASPFIFVGIFVISIFPVLLIEEVFIRLKRGLKND